MRMKSNARPIWPAALIYPILLAACADQVASVPTETSRTICRELTRDLPTYSEADTAETLASGARFIAVFEAVCNP